MKEPEVPQGTAGFEQNQGRGRGARGWSARTRLGAALILCLLASSCLREDPRIRELTTKASQSDDAAQRLRRAWLAQLTRLPRLARNLPRQQSPLTVPFTPEQIRFLQARINTEKDVSSRTLIQEALTQDQEIRELGGQLERLKKELPAPDVTRPGDSHYGLAMRFLRSQGFPEDKARRLISRVPLLDRLAPGFEVYHFLVKGTYATWVTQGSAPCSPLELSQTEELGGLKVDRDRTLARSGRLSQALGGLQAQKRAMELEVSELRLRRENSVEERETLRSEESASARDLNALHYLVAPRRDLEQAGIISVPLLGQSHAGPNWQDSIFNHHLDLRKGRTLQLQARELGLQRIGSIAVVPGSYLENVHFRLAISPDRQTATVELLVLPRFRNDKVIFAVSD